MSGDALRSVPIEMAETARATLGGAIGVAERVGGAAGNALARNARVAFSQSLEIVAVISAIALISMAVIAMLMLRDVKKA